MVALALKPLAASRLKPRLKSNKVPSVSKRTATRRPTLRDVAHIADCTSATVSYVLTGNKKVSISARTRERVVRAAKELGYRPHLGARSLATGRTRTIGLCFGNTGAPPFVDDYDKQIMHGVLQATASESYALQVLANLKGEIPHDVDGWIAVQASGNFDFDALGRVPVVFLDPHKPIPNQACIWAENVQAGRLLATQLASMGRSVLILLHEEMEQTAFSYQMRVLAFREKWKELVPDGQVETAILHPDASRADAEKWLRATSALIRHGNVSHIACLSDLQAALVSPLLREAGLSVPNDVTLSGFDNTLHGLLSSPSISTVDLHAAQTGQLAVAQLIGMLSDVPMENTPPIPPIWIERESTRVPSAPQSATNPAPE
jgi:LacI family transcriptional regulator